MGKPLNSLTSIIMYPQESLDYIHTAGIEEMQRNIYRWVLQKESS